MADTAYKGCIDVACNLTNFYAEWYTSEAPRMIKCIYSIPFCIRGLETHYGENSGYRRFLDLLYCTRADSLLTCRRWIEPICNCSTSSDSYFTIPARTCGSMYLDTGREWEREREREREIGLAPWKTQGIFILSDRDVWFYTRLSITYRIALSLKGLNE